MQLTRMRVSPVLKRAYAALRTVLGVSPVMTSAVAPQTRLNASAILSAVATSGMNTMVWRSLASAHQVSAMAVNASLSSSAAARSPVFRSPPVTRVDARFSPGTLIDRATGATKYPSLIIQ